jgi:hypothetical protein
MEKQTPLDRVILYLENTVETLTREAEAMTARRDGVREALAAAQTIRADEERKAKEAEGKKG